MTQSNSVKITLIVVSAIVFVILLLSFFYIRSSGATVTAQGTSQIKATPDVISVYFTVETKGTTATEAKDANSLIVDNLITALVKKGFERKDIQTQSFNVYKDYIYNYGRSTENGFKASHTVVVQMPTSNTDKIGDVIDAGIDAGATLNYINFELSIENQNRYKAQALKQATEDARLKADSIASGLGKKVGRVVSISTSDFGYSPWLAYSNSAGGDIAMVKEAATSIQPSDQEINANVNVVFAIN